MNREDFKQWLNENRLELVKCAESLALPHGDCQRSDRNSLISQMINDVAQAVDDAIGFVPPQRGGDEETAQETDAASSGAPGAQADDREEFDEETEFTDPSADKLLDRLLYWGVLAWPCTLTDVAFLRF